MADYPFQNTGPYTYTLNDAMRQATGTVLDAFIPGGGKILSGFATPILQRMLGIDKDVMLDAVLMSNMTPYGITRQQQNDLAAQVGKRAMGGAQYAARFKTFQGLQRTLTSQAVWSRLPANQRLGSYQQYIDAQATDKMNNKLWSTVYNMIDPVGANQASRYMGMAAANLIRHGLSAGNRNSYANASAVVGQMFRDKDGNFSFDKKDYGYMSQGQVSALTAALTKDTDFLRGADVTKAGSLKNATTRLRDTVKQYAQALGPLKDIFGKDVPSMIKAVQELSGQSISQLGPQRAKQIAQRSIDSTSTGRYSMTQLAGVTRQFDTALQQMDVPVLNKIGANLMATRALDAAQGGALPAYMTRATFVNKTADTVLRTANSKGADQIAMAYSLWAQRQTAQGQQDTSYSAFKNTLDAAAAKSGDYMKSMLDVAGVNNRWDLKQGRAFDFYAQAKQDGMANDMAFDANFQRTQRQARLSLMSDMNFKSALQRATGRYQEYTGADADRIFKSTMATVSDSPQIMNLNGNARLLAIANKQGFKDASGNTMQLNSMQDYQKLTQTQKSQVQQINATMNYISTNQHTSNLYAQIFAARNMRKQSQATARAARRRQFVKQLDVDMADSSKDLIGKILGLDSGKGMHDNSFKDIFNASTALSNAGDQQTRRETLASMSVGADLAKKIYGNVVKGDWSKQSIQNQQYYLDRIMTTMGANSKEFGAWQAQRKKAGKTVSYGDFQRQKAQQLYKQDRDKQRDFVMDYARYTNSAQGLGNQSYRAALSSYLASTDTSRTGDAYKRWLIANDKSDVGQNYKSFVQEQQKLKQRSTGLMGIYRNVSTDAVKAFVENNVLDTTPGAKPDKAANQQQLIDLMNKRGTGAVKSRIEKSSISRKLDALQSSSDHSSFVKAFRQKLDDQDKWLSGTDSFDQQAFKKRVDEERKRLTRLSKSKNATEADTAKKDLASLDAMVASVNQARQGNNMQPASLQDILGRLPNLFQQLIDTLKSINTRLTTTPKDPK